MTIPVETIESLHTEVLNDSLDINEIPEFKEDNQNQTIELPDIAFIERTSRESLIEMTRLNFQELNTDNLEIKNQSESLTDVEKANIKEETGWSDEIIESIKNLDQYEVLKNANLIEAEINGRKCLVKENIDLDYVDGDGITNRERVERGLAPIDTETGKPFELHHLGQKADSPLVELTIEEHRIGEYKEGKKNQSLWHDNSIESEVHGEGNTWDQERREHWKARSTTIA